MIADDQLLFAEGLKYVLESRADDIEVIGIVADGQEAVEAVDADPPDIVLMDVRMPKMDGVEATRRIREAHRDVKVLMLTTFDDDEYVHDSMRNGAIGYLLKNRPPMELIVAIRAVQRGIVQIDPAISAALFAEGSTTERPDDNLEMKLQTFTRREIDVLRLLVQALGNKQIANQLFVAEQTVRNHVSVIYAKLNLENRMQILQHADDIKAYLRRHAS